MHNREDSTIPKLGRSFVSLTIMAFLFSSAYAPSARAVVIYDWAGFCATGCVGVAIAKLTLADTYVPGTQVKDADFVAFSYSSSSGSYSIPTDLGFLQFDGPAILPVPPMDQALIGIDFEGSNTAFGTPLGPWFSRFSPSGIFDEGSKYSWFLRVAEPSTLALFVIGLGGLGVLERRRRREQLHESESMKK